MAERTEMVVVGAGPYGLSAAAHLREAGHDVRVFGEPLEFWRTKTPTGMLLRSPYLGSNIGDPKGSLTLEDYEAAHGYKISVPIPVGDFISYGLWYQERMVPDVDRRGVARIERTADGFLLVLDDDEPVLATRVILATGIGAFEWHPPQFDELGPDLTSHSLDYGNLAQFEGKRVTVIGGGQSALESAALLRAAGADVDVLIRAPQVRWVGHAWTHRWPQGALLYAPADVGPAGVSQLIARPNLYRSLPRRLQERWNHRAVRPAGATWLTSRLRDVPLRVNTEVTEARPVSGRVRLRLNQGADQTVDHVLLATGYRVDLSRYSFLSVDLVRRIDHVNGYPRLSHSFETTVPGLHVIGAPAAWSFGPLMKFVAGSGFAATALTHGLKT